MNLKLNFGLLKFINMKKLSLLLFSLTIISSTFSQVILLDEEFENSSGLPQGWDENMTMSGNHWSISTAPNSHYLVIPYHSNIASLNEGDSDETLPGEYLISPTFDLTAYTSAFLSVDVFFKAMSFFSYTETASIEVSIDDGNTWSVLKNITGLFNWHKVFVDISAYCGNNNVKIAIKYSDNAGWLYGIGIDNVKIFVPYTNDGALLKIKEHDFVLINDPVKISGLVQNTGTSMINTFNINYTVNKGNINSQNFSSLSMSPLDTLSFDLSDPWIPTTQESFDIKIWISDINEIPDENPLNDTLNIHVINAVSSKPEKNILLEVFGATWCTLCPHASSKISEIKDSIDNLLVAVVHINDPFTFDIGTEIFNNYHLHPGWLVTGLIERYNFSEDVSIDMDRYLWPHHVYERNNAIAPVDLSLTNNYDPETRELNIYLIGTFMCDLTGDFRFNCYILEDSILWEQANCLTIPDREPYCFKDYWIYDPPGIISNYIHMNVLRDVLGGTWGTESSLPGTVLNGNSYDFQYDYTVPDQYDTNNLKIIGIIQKYDADSSKCSILNAKDVYLDVSSDINADESNNDLLYIFPNPMENIIYLSSDKLVIYEISNIYGRVVLSGSTNKTINIETLNSGSYILKVYDQKRNLLKTEKLIKR